MAQSNFQETMDRIHLLIRAGYPVIYVVSLEEDRVLECLSRIYRAILKENPQKTFVTWFQGKPLTQIKNIPPLSGEPSGDWLRVAGLPGESERQKNETGLGHDDLAKALDAVSDGTGPSLADALVVFFDLHPKLMHDKSTGESGSLVRSLRNAAKKLRKYYHDNRTTKKRSYKTIVVVAPTATGLSMELERDMIRIDFPLPERDELLMALNEAIERNEIGAPVTDPDESEVQAVCKGEARGAEEYAGRLQEVVAAAGRGLTLEDYRLGLNMFGVRNEPLCSRHIEDMLNLKAKAVSNQALQYTPNVRIDLGGLKLVRDWIAVRSAAALSEEVRRHYRLPPPKGALLLGVSGGGKSQLAKLIAKEFKLALLRLDVGALFGSFIGESEERTRQALTLAEVLAPVVLWVDEIDKAFQGMGEGGDSGVSARVFGHILTWLAEKSDSVFVVATANDFRGMLKRFPELGRKGRFDAIFWVDLPGPEGRQAIFDIYLRPLLPAARGDSHWNSDGGVELHVTEQDVADLRHLVEPDEPIGPSAFDRFCWLLGHDAVSADLTGAEIEYAVTDAKYQLYDAVSKGTAQLPPMLTPAFVMAAVVEARTRALYRLGAEARGALDELRGVVDSAGWPKVS